MLPNTRVLIRVNKFNLSTFQELSAAKPFCVVSFFELLLQAPVLLFRETSPVVEDKTVIACF